MNLCRLILLFCAIAIASCVKSHVELPLQSPSGLKIANTTADLTALVKRAVANDFPVNGNLRVTNIEYHEGIDKTFALIHYSVSRETYQNLVFVFSSAYPDMNTAGYTFKCTSDQCKCTITLYKNEAGQVTSAECGGGCQSCHFEQTPN